MNEQYWIKGPTFDGEKLHRVSRYGCNWENGFSGPWSKQETARISGRVPNCYVLTQEDYEAANPQSTSADVTKLTEKVADLEANLASATEALEETSDSVLKADDEDVVGSNDADLSNLKRANWRKQLMTRAGFKDQKFKKHAQAWAHFEEYVLPYLLK